MQRFPLVSVLVALAASSASAGVKLGKPKVTRNDKYIVDFELGQVAPSPEDVGVGGIARKDSLDFKGCGDAPSGPEQGWKGRELDGGNGVTIKVTDVVDAGKSKRDWPGVRCGFKVIDAKDPSKWADVPADRVPSFNSPTGVVRDGDRAYINLNFNGYAAEASGGNLVVALDLASHKELWRSAKTTSNGSIMLIGDALVTGYGFSGEKHFLIAFDAATGKQLQKLDLPKTPETMSLKDGKLYVKLYDGYAVFPVTGLPAK